jgi:hypothetical protein
MPSKSWSVNWLRRQSYADAQNRRRTVRSGLETVDVEARGVANNGNVIVMPEEEARSEVEYEDLIINRKRYRVPEKIIRLDFWDKLGLSKGSAAGRV